MKARSLFAVILLSGCGVAESITEPPDNPCEKRAAGPLYCLNVEGRPIGVFCDENREPTSLVCDGPNGCLGAGGDMMCDSLPREGRPCFGVFAANERCDPENANRSLYCGPNRVWEARDCKACVWEISSTRCEPSQP